MIVESSSERLRELRRNLIEMLFVEGNHFCMFCEKSGHCELQALAYRFGVTAPKYPYLFPKREVDASHADIFFDGNRCVLCARCVRASRELDQRNALGFVGRGPDKSLVGGGEELSETDLEQTDRAIDICPVGALLPKRVGYVVPIGDRRYDREPIGSDIEAEKASADDE
jgi:[NiFe] hydrogenase diaphorase moiety small subunit